MITQRRSSSPRPRPSYIAVEIVPDDTEPNFGKTLMELGREDCKWPIGDPQSPDFRFCGRKQFEGRPYCGNCCAIAYQQR